MNPGKYRTRSNEQGTTVPDQERTIDMTNPSAGSPRPVHTGFPPRVHHSQHDPLLRPSSSRRLAAAVGPRRPPVAAPIANPSPPSRSPPTPTPRRGPRRCRSGRDAGARHHSTEDSSSDAMPIKVSSSRTPAARTSTSISPTPPRPPHGRRWNPEHQETRCGSRHSTTQDIDATTLKLTSVGWPIDNALALYIDEHEGPHPLPAGPARSRAARQMRMGFKSRS